MAFQDNRQKNKRLQPLDLVKRSKLNKNIYPKGNVENQAFTNMENVKKNEALC